MFIFPDLGQSFGESNFCPDFPKPATPSSCWEIGGRQWAFHGFPFKLGHLFQDGLSIFDCVPPKRTPYAHHAVCHVA